jgi:hypothetical protein
MADRHQDMVSGPSTPRDPRHHRGLRLLSRRGSVGTPEPVSSSSSSSSWNRPHRLTGLHQVTTIPQTPESSPMSPSMNPSSLVSSVNPMRSGPGRNRNHSIGSPTLYYGTSFSVSALGFESHADVHEGDNEDGSSSSSSEDNCIHGGYDSDDRMSDRLRPGGGDPSSGHAEDHLEGFSSSFKYKLTRAGEKKKQQKQEPAIRQVQSNSKSLRPKARNFLRISRDLQEEMAPLDYEIRREAEITMAMRDGDETSDPRPTYTNPNLHKAFRQNTIATSDTDDSDIVPTSPQSKPSGILKRKAAIVDESVDSNTLKRRAVSPGVSSPIIGSPTNIGAKHSSMKQVQDTSEGFQNMSL